ncbi:MAG: putative sulfate exporter family transporter [Actinomycetota bacterium]
MRRIAPGVALTVAVGLVAGLLARVVPLLGAPVLAILLGLVVAAVRRPPAAAAAGIAFSGKTLLQVAIVLLGTGLGLGQVVRVGGRSLPVMLGTLAVALLGAVVVGRLLAVSPRLRTLIGVGTGICGASAIAAISGIIAATSTEIAYAISAIFVFNVVAVLVFPPLGHLLGLSQRGFGLWAGTAVNDTSSVVAAAYAYGHPAGAYAVVVKLTRTTLIVPIALALSVVRARSESGAGVRVAGLVPWFLLWFLFASALETAGLIRPALHRPLSDAALALITVALAGVGLSSDLRGMRTIGVRPLVLGALLWVAVAGVSLGLQALTHQL